jgi:uncharacterized protein YndB with AHSA1/START domain
MKNEPFIIEKVYQAPVDRVWKAISNKEDMRQWYFDLSDFKPEVGFEFEFEGKNEGHTYIHQCRVTEVVMEKKLQYTWKYKGYEGLSYVTFELFPEGDATRLKLTHEGLETFPGTEAFKKESFAQGWTALISRLLPEYLSRSAA